MRVFLIGVRIIEQREKTYASLSLISVMTTLLLAFPSSRFSLPFHHNNPAATSSETPADYQAWQVSSIAWTPDFFQDVEGKRGRRKCSFAASGDVPTLLDNSLHYTDFGLDCTPSRRSQHRRWHWSSWTPQVTPRFKPAPCRAEPRWSPREL